MHTIRMGVPEMEELWNDLTHKADRGELKGEEKRLFKKLTKTLAHLRHNLSNERIAERGIVQKVKKVCPFEREDL